MRVTRVGLTAAALSFGLASSVVAQQAPVAVGQMVRLAIKGGWMTGEVRTLAPDSIVLGRGDSFATFQWKDVSQVQRAIGKKNRAGRGIVRGALAGGLGLGLAGLAVGGNCSSSDFVCFDRGTTAAGGALFGALVGGVLGGVAGALTKSTVWERVTAPTTAGPVAIAPIVTPRKVGVSFRVRF